MTRVVPGLRAVHIGCLAAIAQADQGVGKENAVIHASGGVVVGVPDNLVERASVEVRIRVRARVRFVLTLRSRLRLRLRLRLRF